MIKLSSIKRYKQAYFGLFLMSVIIICAVFAPQIAPHNPVEQNIRNRLHPPSREYLAGTDNFGRDVFSRVLYGTRISLIVALSVIAVCGTLGTLLGLISGYFKLIDAILMRLMDGLMAFPAVLLALFILAALGPGLKNIILALSISYIPRVARQVRGSVLSVKEYTHVEAARAAGVSDLRILFVYILPLCWSPIIIRLTLLMALTILSEASLTFLGVGISPEVPSWGNIMSEGRTYLSASPWQIIAPGIAIIVSVLALNVLGDSLRDILDPKLGDV